MFFLYIESVADALPLPPIAVVRPHANRTDGIERDVIVSVGVGSFLV